MSPIIETGARHNLFLMLFSVSLIFGAISNIIVVFEKWDYVNNAWILYGISAILLSLSFLLKQQVPRNFGFIALALFSLFDGINVGRLAFGFEDTLYYFSVNGILALAAGIFFISHRQTWKNFGFIMGSGCLILTGLAGFWVYDSNLNPIFLFLSVLFAIPAAIYFLLRK